MATQPHRPGDGMANGIPDGISDVAYAIADAYDAMLRLRPAPDAFPAVGRGRLAGGIERRVRAGDPIEWLLPGFACKNPNRARTLGDLPDLAESSALRHLEGFCAAVDALYRPPWHAFGCRLTLVADGRVWADLVGVDPATAAAYGSALRRMAEPLPHLRIVGLEELLPMPTAGELERRFAAPESEAPASEAPVAARFDRLAAEDPATADTARLERRQRAFAALLDARFPEHLRLTVHPRDDAGPKFSCRFGPRLPPAGEIPTLPYHGVAVRSAAGDAVEIMPLDAAWALPGGVRVETYAPSHSHSQTHTHHDAMPWCLRRLQP